jgi:hypothetical protein
MSKILAYTVSSEEMERLKEVDLKYAALRCLIERNNPAFITVSMIANSLGMSRQAVTNQPWHLPNFGKVDSKLKTNRKRFWHFEEYLDWVAIPEYERRMMYREMIYNSDSL